MSEIRFFAKEFAANYAGDRREVQRSAVNPDA